MKLNGVYHRTFPCNFYHTFDWLFKEYNTYLLAIIFLYKSHLYVGISLGVFKNWGSPLVCYGFGRNSIPLSRIWRFFNIWMFFQALSSLYQQRTFSLPFILWCRKTADEWKGNIIICIQSVEYKGNGAPNKTKNIQAILIKCFRKIRRQISENGLCIRYTVLFLRNK